MGIILLLLVGIGLTVDSIQHANQKVQPNPTESSIEKADPAAASTSVDVIMQPMATAASEATTQ